MAEADVELRLRRRPPPEALRWVTDAVGAGERISSIRRLRGGTSTAMHAINVADARGHRHRLVLRRFVRSDWLAIEPDLPQREASVLRLLEGSDIPAPWLVAVDADSTACDVPAVLMTRLPGHVTFVPDDMTSWLTQLAAVLPAIHAVDSAAHAAVQPYRPYNDLHQLEPPPWSNWPGAWAKALDLVAGPAPETSHCFIHRDYHPGNVLWARGQLSGIIDWVNASWGPPGIDFGHCRRNLAQLHGLEVADRFLASYRTVDGAFDHHPYWDLVTAMDSDWHPEPGVFRGWIEHGVRGLTPALIRSRLDDYVASIVARV